MSFNQVSGLFDFYYKYFFQNVYNKHDLTFIALDTHVSRTFYTHCEGIHEASAIILNETSNLWMRSATAF